jgi:RNA polymerase sigma-70 factor, ECF subfamily
MSATHTHNGLTALWALTAPGRARRSVQDPEEKLKALFVAGLQGDQRAYRAALDLLSRYLRAFLRKRLMAQPAEVEDLLQESLLAIHLNRHTYDTSQLFTPWAYTITRHKLIDFTRRHARTQAPLEPLDEAHELLASQDDQAHEAHRDVHRLLNQLPDRHRLPIVHTKLEGLSVAEAAALTGMSESAIKIGVHRGLKALAALMKEKFA